MNDLNVKIAQTFEDFLNFSSEIISRNPIVLGFDTETALSHQNTSVSLIQFYDGYTCYLFRISKVENPPSQFLKLLGKSYIKVGFDVEMDAYKLRKYSNFEVFGILDIQHLLKSLNYPFSSMKDAIQHFCQYEMKKGINHESWDNKILDEKAVQYAAYDAYLSYDCYFKILKMNRPEYQEIKDESYLEDRDEILNILRSIQKVKSMKLKSAINFITNSYAGWRNKYKESNRREYAQKVFDKLEEEGKITIDGLVLHFSPSEIEINISNPLKSNLFQPDINLLRAEDFWHPENNQTNPPNNENIFIKHLRERVTIPNIKLKSLINILTNSYSPWKNINIDERRRCAFDIIQILERQNLIKKNLDGTYNIF